MIRAFFKLFEQPAPTMDARTLRIIERTRKHEEERQRYAARRARELRQARERFEAVR